MITPPVSDPDADSSDWVLMPRGAEPRRRRNLRSLSVSFFLLRFAAHIDIDKPEEEKEEEEKYAVFPLPIPMSSTPIRARDPVR